MSQKRGFWLRIAGISGVLSPIVAFTCIAVSIASYPQFSWTGNALSDLGVVKGITAITFNSGLIAGGVLALAFAIGLFSFLTNNMLGKVGALIFILVALSLIAIGVFPENAKPMHYYASVAFFVTIPLSTLCVGVAFLLKRKVILGLFTFLVALFAALVWGIHWTVGFGSNVAIPETLSAASIAIWCVAMGVKMLTEASHSA